MKVPFKGQGKPGDRMVFAKTYEVGWDAARPVRHYRVTFKQLNYLTQLDDVHGGMTNKPQLSTPPDELALYVDVAGQWRQLADPRLLHVNLGDTLTISEKFDLYLADGASFRIVGSGRECDITQIAECPVPPDEVGFNDDAGLFRDTYRAGPAIAGDHVGTGTSHECQSATATPCFSLLYRIDNLGGRGAATNRGTAQATTTAVSSPVTQGGSSSSWPVFVIGIAAGGAAVAAGIAISRRRRDQSS